MHKHDLALRIRFRAGRENLTRVRSLVETLLGGAPGGTFHTEDIDEIVLGLQECLANVARHACPGDREPMVHLSVGVSDGCFRARVTDRGREFDPEAVPPPDLANPRDNGYGLFLLRSTMDRVRFTRRGRVNRVEFERRGRATPPDADAVPGESSVKSSAHQGR